MKHIVILFILSLFMLVYILPLKAEVIILTSDHQLYDLIDPDKKIDMSLGHIPTFHHSFDDLADQISLGYESRTLFEILNAINAYLPTADQSNQYILCITGEGEITLPAPEGANRATLKNGKQTVSCKIEEENLVFLMDKTLSGKWLDLI